MGVILSSMLNLARFVIVEPITAASVQVFWRGQAAQVRPIDFKEALAIVLMTSILFGRRGRDVAAGLIGAGKENLDRLAGFDLILADDLSLN